MSAENGSQNGSPPAPAARPPKHSPTREQLVEQIALTDREPFAWICADLLATWHTSMRRGDIVKFMRKSPDRFMQSVTMAAKLSGFRDQVDVRSAVLDLRQLSDAELLQRAEANRPALDAYRSALAGASSPVDADTPTQATDNAEVDA